MKHFFISYTQSDRKKAEWVAWHLEKAGYSVVIQAWDFKLGENFVNNMNEAMEDTRRTLCILSPDYLKSRFTKPEWMAAFTRDPDNQKGALITLRVQPIKNFQGILAAYAYIDLVGVSEDEAVERLLSGIREACHARDGTAEPDLLPPQERPNLSEPSWNEAFGTATAIASKSVQSVAWTILLGMVITSGIYTFLGSQLTLMHDNQPEILATLSVIAGIFATLLAKAGWYGWHKLKK